MLLVKCVKLFSSPGPDFYAGGQGCLWWTFYLLLNKLLLIISYEHFI